MPRRPEPWYWQVRDGWYVQINRKQVLLAKGEANKTAAYEAFYKLMATEGHVTPAKDLTLGELVARFRSWSEGEHAASTRTWYDSHLNPLLSHKKIASRKADDITPADISGWIASRKLGQSTKRGAITAVKALYSFAEKNCRIRNDSIRHMERPPMRRRQAASDEQRRQIKEAVKDEAFSDFLTVITESGMRPGEAMALTADMVNLTEGIITFHGKTSTKTGKNRIVFMTDELKALIQRLMAAHPQGQLLLNTDGNPWTTNAVRCRFRRLRGRLGMKGIVCYSLRHAYLSDALEAGVPIAQVAELAGHSDTKMITEVYSHLQERTEHMRKAAEKAAKRD